MLAPGNGGPAHHNVTPANGGTVRTLPAGTADRNNPCWSITPLLGGARREFLTLGCGRLLLDCRQHLPCNFIGQRICPRGAKCTGVCTPAVVSGCRVPRWRSFVLGRGGLLLDRRQHFLRDLFDQRLRRRARTFARFVAVPVGRVPVCRVLICHRLMCGGEFDLSRDLIARLQGS